VLLDVLEVGRLVRRAAVQVGAAGAQLRALVVGDRGGGRGVLRRQLDQPELDVVDRQRLLATALEAPQRLRRPRRLRRPAPQREHLAAVRDG